MTEPIIHDTVPSGSPILAYGTRSNEGGLKPRLVWFLVVAVAVLAIIITLALSILLSPVPLPKDTVMLAYDRTHQDLTHNDPRVWQEARARHKDFPVFVGMAQTANGEIPFAIEPHFWRLGKDAPQGFWQVASAEPLSIARTERSFSLVPLSRQLSRLWLTLWLSQEAALSGPVTVQKDELVWRTNLSAPTSRTLELSGPNAINLKDLPDAWPLLQATLAVQGLNFDLPDHPMSVSWTSANRQNPPSIALFFEEPMSDLLKITLLGGVGLADKRLTTLPDGSLSTELVLPSALLANATSAHWTLPDGREVLLETQAIYLGDAATLMKKPTIPATCTGQPIAIFDGESLKTMSQALPRLSVFATKQLVWTKDTERITACWKK